MERRRSRPACAACMRLFALMALAGLATGGVAGASDADRSALAEPFPFDTPFGDQPAPSPEAPRTYIPLRQARPDEVEQQFKPGQNTSFLRWSKRAKLPSAAPIESGSDKGEQSPNTVSRTEAGKATGSSGSAAPGASRPSVTSVSVTPPNL